MSIGFNWFKQCEITEIEDYYHTKQLDYIGGGSSSHSAGRMCAAQELLRKYGGVEIPHIDSYMYVSDKLPKLVPPNEMSKACELVLKTTEVDELDIRDRIEDFKYLSDQGYYLSYDWS